MSPWLFNVYMNLVMQKVKMGMGKRGESGLLYADDLVLCGKSEVNLRVMVGQFFG